MAMNRIILERRKALGFTQEQLADYLGVTTPAVNKWEKGTSCPDIGLLAPLARLLKTDLNTLLEFNREVTRQELLLFCKEISRAAQEDGFEKAFRLAEEKLCEYPGSDTLLHNLALQLQGLLVSAALDEDRSGAYLEKINGWYERLTESGDAVIRNSAFYMLASYEISRQRYERAQDYLDRMPDRKDTPDKRMLQAGIYLKQNRPEEAARLMQGALLAAVSDIQMILFKLADAELALGDFSSAEYAAERAEKTAQLFDLSEYNSLVAHFQLAVAGRDAGRSVELLRKMLKSQGEQWEASESPLYRLVLTNKSGASIEKMTVPLLESMKKSGEFSFLHKDKGFKALLAEYGIV